jgi:hypothetical protein
MEVLDLSADPQTLALNGYDGIWVELKSRAKPSPLVGRTLQWIDWKLQGQLSRWLLEEKGESSAPLFVPTMRKIPAKYVILVKRLDARQLKQGCEGLGLRKVLVLCEEGSRAQAVGKDLAAKGGEWAERLDIAVDKDEEAAI